MISFDRVAGIYDATRGLPAGVPDLVAGSIIAATGANRDSRFLELGVGTGRIAVPLAARGVRYTGIDISTEMVQVLREKARKANVNIDLRMGDITSLPFEDGNFDVVIAVHIMHLVPEWKAALAEARRVTRAHGYFVLAGNWSTQDRVESEVIGEWRRLVGEHGWKLRSRYGPVDLVDAELTRLGCRTAVYRAAVWEEEFIPLKFVMETRNRVRSETWDVPEETLEAVHQEMLPWLEKRFGDATQPLSQSEEFRVSASRWTEEHEATARVP